MRTDAHSPMIAAVGAQVQVQIVTYNSRATIDACLQAVMQQRGVRVRIFMVDNASADDTVAYVQAHYPDVTVLAQDSNTGYASAHNQGFAQALADGVPYVLTLNPDVRLAPDYLAQAVAACERSSGESVRVAGITGKLLRPQAAEDKSPPTLDSTGLQMEALYHVRDRGSGVVDRGQYDEQTLVWGVCGAAAVYTRAFLQDLALHGAVLDESFFLYKEDVDLCWRARLLGWHFLYAPLAVATHDRGWKVGARVSEVAAAHSWANQIALLQTYCSWWSPVLWLAVVVEGVRLLWLACRRPRVALRALQVVRERQTQMRRKRRQYARLPASDQAAQAR